MSGYSPQEYTFLEKYVKSLEEELDYEFSSTRETLPLAPNPIVSAHVLYQQPSCSYPLNNSPRGNSEPYQIHQTSVPGQNFSLSPNESPHFPHSFVNPSL
eukprot:Sdes_comp21848_c0_seq1m20405